MSMSECPNYIPYTHTDSLLFVCFFSLLLWQFEYFVAKADMLHCRFANQCHHVQLRHECLPCTAKQDLIGNALSALHILLLCVVLRACRATHAYALHLLESCMHRLTPQRWCTSAASHGHMHSLRIMLPPYKHVAHCSAWHLCCTAPTPLCVQRQAQLQKLLCCMQHQGMCVPTQHLSIQVESVDQAFDLLDDMVSHGVPPDCTTYSTLMNLCAEAKQGHRAYQLLQVRACMLMMTSARSHLASRGASDHCFC